MRDLRPPETNPTTVARSRAVLHLDDQLPDHGLHLRANRWTKVWVDEAYQHSG